MVPFQGLCRLCETWGVAKWSYLNSTTWGTLEKDSPGKYCVTSDLLKKRKNRCMHFEKKHQPQLICRILFITSKIGTRWKNQPLLLQILIRLDSAQRTWVNLPRRWRVQHFRWMFEGAVLATSQSAQMTSIQTMLVWICFGARWFK